MLFQSQLTELLHLLPAWRKQSVKKAMRGILEQKRRILTDEQIAAQSADILAHLEALPEFQAAKVVMAFYPIRHEVDMRPLLNKYKDEKVILLPVAHRQTIELRRFIGRKDLKLGRFGIPEPQTPTYDGPRPDMIIVPGVGFDRKHNRLGRGRGYYDRFLRSMRGAMKVAVAYDFQIVKEIPHNFLDKKVDRIITPTEVI